jgi:Glycosyl hydrolase family 81 C-terminal domain
MWLYKGHEFVRELEVHGFLPFFDHLTLVVGTYLLDNPDGKPLYDRVYSTLREWFWREEKAPAGTSDSFAWNYFSYGGPEANPYMYSWAALIENLTVADQLASAKWDGTAGLQQDIDFKTPKWRVAALMRDKILETLKQLAHQWFDVYTAQCLQYNNKYKTICGYPEGYFCVQNLCDHHYHWGYFLRAAAAIGRHDPDWLERHWTALEMLIRDSANYDRKDTRFPIQRNFSAFYGHCWANGTARNNGQDHESASEALNFAFGMVELATLRGDPTMLAVGLWLYEEQVCATQQYWFNVDADLDNDPKDHGLGDPAYYNGNWPKKFVRFKRGDETWNTTIAAMVTQQSISRQTYFGGLQGCYSIHMVPVGAPNLYLERHGDWNDRTYKTYLQNIHTLSQQQQDSLPYENVIAMWQAAAKPTSDTKNLKPFEEPGVLGAIRRVEKQHVRYYPAVNSLAFSYIYARAAYGRLRPHTCSNAVHAAVFDSADEPNSQYFLVYNPSSKPIDVKFWDRKTGLPEFERYSVPERTFIYLWYNKQTKERADNFGQYAYTPSLVASPAGRLYLRKGASGKPLEGLLDSKPGTQGPDGTKPYPKDLSDSQLQSIIIKLGIGKKNATKFSGTFSGKLTDVFRYTRFSLFLNPVLYPGWTRDEIRSVGAGVEVLIEYDFGAVDGKSRTRTEFYGDPGKPGVADSKFNLETTNTWLNHNALTEYATTTVPLLRLPSLNPNKPYCEGVQFADVSEAKNATISVSIWQAENAPKKPDIYLSYNCPLSFEWASWIRPPYE